MLLRLLFPSWAFFDAVTEVPALEVRVCANGTWGAWGPALVAPPRTALSLLYNPRGTVHLAAQSVVDRLALESEQQEITPLSVDLVTQIASHVLGTALATCSAWEWRVVARVANAPQDSSRELYVHRVRSRATS